MRKLLNFMLFIAFVVAACFITGCGDTHDDWNNGKKNPPVGDDANLVLTIGIQQQIADVRAAINPMQSITFEGIIFALTSTEGNIAYYTGKLDKAGIVKIDSKKYAELLINGYSYKISSDFFKNAYNDGVNTKVQPTASITFSMDVEKNLTVLAAASNGKATEKPTVTKILDEKVTLSLSNSQEMITVTVPNTVGTVKEFTSWVLLFNDNTAGKSVTITNGEYAKYYDAVPDYTANILYVVLTTAGKELFQKGHSYSGSVTRARVMLSDGTYKDLDVSACKIDNVIWNK